MKIEIAKIPQLETQVRIHGGTKQIEVGGPICVSALVSLGLLLIAR